MSMGKRILGWLRQRCVAVWYGFIWCLVVPWIACFLWKTVVLISVRVQEENAALLGYMYIAIVGFPGVIILIGACRRCVGWRVVLTTRLILILVQVGVFWCLFAPISDSMAFYIGTEEPIPGLVSTYEVLFIYLLFVTCASFQCWLIANESRRHEVTRVVGGVLAIMGILMPKLLESYSILNAHCSVGRCSLGDKDGIALFEMGIACAATLSMMFVVGLFSELIVRFIRSLEEILSAMSRESSLADSHNAEGSVPRSEITAASDKQSDGVELALGSASTTVCVPQETADGVVPPVCSEETSARPTVSLASSSVSRGDDEGLTRSMESVMGPVGVSVPGESSGGLGSVAVSRQLMTAAVSGVVAGVCFSVVSRLFGRR